MKAGAECEAEPDDNPQQADHAHRDKALEHRRHDVLGADHAAVEEREPWSHQQHEPGRGQHPRCIARIDWAAGDRLRCRTEERARQADCRDQQKGNG